MSHEVRFRQVARTEFDEGVDWYGDQSTELGKKFTASLDSCVNAIAEDPLRYPTVHGKIRLRSVLGFPYQVYYRALDNDIVEVIAVFHVRRNPAIWQSRI